MVALEGFSTWVDAFLSQDNYGANTGNNDRSKEPGNQLAGIDLRYKVFDAPIALYGQLVGEDEDKFLPNCLMFQYGIEGWKNLGSTQQLEYLLNMPTLHLTGGQMTHEHTIFPMVITFTMTVTDTRASHRTLGRPRFRDFEYWRGITKR